MKTLHKLLGRQLAKLGLSEEIFPTDKIKWLDLLERINLNYSEADHERYLLERSMEVSSREMQALNFKLEQAQYQEIAELQQKLLETARKAGMADMATSILHNVGNSLNTLKVSTSLVHDKLNERYFQNLFTIVDRLKQHKGQLREYLLDDDKGKLIPEYLMEVIASIQAGQNEMQREVIDIFDQVQYIKEITEMQKSLSGLPERIVEKIYLSDLIDKAIKMCSGDFNKLNIQIEKKVEQGIYFNSDKFKLIQILVNLLLNAKDAVMQADKKVKILKVAGRMDKAKKQVVIDVSDNGIGIRPDKINEIFTFGVTTKEHGHGFGLHGSSIAVMELGGTIQASSSGEGKGAVFRIILPVKKTVEMEVSHESRPVS